MAATSFTALNAKDLRVVDVREDGGRVVVTVDSALSHVTLVDRFKRAGYTVTQVANHVEGSRVVKREVYVRKG